MLHCGFPIFTRKCGKVWSFVALWQRNLVDLVWVRLLIYRPIQWPKLDTKMLTDSFDNHARIHQKLAIRIRVYLHWWWKLWQDFLSINRLIIRSLHIEVLGLGDVRT